MLDSFLYSMNAVLPICLIMLIGRLIRGRIVPQEFFELCDKLVFRITLPLLLFQSVAESEASASDSGLFLFAFAAIALSIALPWLIVPFFVKDNAKRGALIQGMFRSNAAILGLPLAELLFGEEGRAKFSIFISITLILFNVFSVILLTVYSPEKKRAGGIKTAAEVTKGVITNPLVIGTLAGLPFMLIEPLELPKFAAVTVDYLAGVTTPLALLSLGASVAFTKDDSGRLSLAVIATAVKSVVFPAAATVCAYFLGFRGADIGTLFILCAVPSAVVSYVMGKNMKSDYVLSGQIVVMTTVTSLFTMFAGLFIMKQTGII